MRALPTSYMCVADSTDQEPALLTQLPGSQLEGNLAAPLPVLSLQGQRDTLPLLCSETHGRSWALAPAQGKAHVPHTYVCENSPHGKAL